MEIRHGPPVTGSNFFPRPELIAKLLRALRRGHVAFLGPRRTGKTSCLEAIRAHPEEFVPLYLNLEKFERVESWFEAMVKDLRTILSQQESALTRAHHSFGGFLHRLQSVDLKWVGVQIEISKSPAPDLPWRKPAEDFLALLKESPVPILFLLDEFPTFLKLVAERRSVQEAGAVLNWFRGTRSELKDLPIRFLVTGSIGLKGVVRKLRLAPSVNEFDTLKHDGYLLQQTAPDSGTTFASNILRDFWRRKCIA